MLALLVSRCVAEAPLRLVYRLSAGVQADDGEEWGKSTSSKDMIDLEHAQKTLISVYLDSPFQC